MTIIKDDRPANHEYDFMVLATDKFMSGWGEARGGASYAAWACHWEDLPRVQAWVESRSEMKRVRVVGADYRPGRGCAHLHIYVVGDNHPAFGSVGSYHDKS